MPDRPTRRTVVAVVAALAVAGPARADYQFQLADGSGAAANTFTVAQGSAVDVRVYLVETRTTTFTDIGLTSAGVKLGGFNADVAAVRSVPVRGPQWDSSRGTAGNPATLRVFQDIGAPVSTSPDATGASRVLVGTFRFTGVSAGTTAFVTGDPGPGADTVLADGRVLDGLIGDAAGVVTVTAVPEPGPLALSVVAAVPVMLRLRRQER